MVYAGVRLPRLALRAIPRALAWNLEVPAMFTRLTIAALAAVALSGCAVAHEVDRVAPDPSPAPTTTPLVGTNDECVVAMHGSNDDPGDVTPPCRLDWYMRVGDDVPAVEFADECSDAGGVLLGPSEVLAGDDIWLCQDIDY